LNKISARQLRRRIVHVKQNVSNSSRIVKLIREPKVQRMGEREVPHQNINNMKCSNDETDEGNEELSLVNNSFNGDNHVNLCDLELQMGNMSNHKSDNNIEVQNKSLKDELSEWAVQNNIRLNALSHLLKIVKPHVSETVNLMLEHYSKHLEKLK